MQYNQIDLAASPMAINYQLAADVEPLSKLQQTITELAMVHAEQCGWAPDLSVYVYQTIHGHVVEIHTTRTLPGGTEHAPQRLGSRHIEALASLNKSSTLRWVEWSMGRLILGV